MSDSSSSDQSKDQEPGRLAITISVLLISGLMLSILLVLIGEAIALSKHATVSTHYGIFLGAPSEFRSIPNVLSSLTSGKGRAVIQLGILVLMATPVARVLLSAIGFAIEGDRRFVFISLLVLVMLLYSLFCTT